MAIGLAIGSLVLGGLQYRASRKAANKQEDIARDNMQLQKRETEEASRRERSEADRIESASRARAAASGVLMTGSQGEYLSEQQKANQDRIRWLQESGASRASIIDKEGTATAKATRTAGLGKLASSVGQSYSYWKMQ